MSIIPNNIRGKIMAGYLAVIVILIAVVMTTIFTSRQVNNTSDRLYNLRTPTSVASMQAVNGIYQSTASLRSWVLFNDSSYLKERQMAWSDQIRPAIAQMDLLSKNWTNTKNIERLSKIKTLLITFEQVQKNIVIQHATTPDLALLSLKHEATLLANELKGLLQDMANNQKELMNQDFAKLLEQMDQLIYTEWILLVTGIVLGITLAVVLTNTIIRPVNKAVQVAQEIGSGNLQVEISLGSMHELNVLGGALTGMRDSLFEKDQQNIQYNWLKSGQNGLNEIIRGDKKTKQLANDITEFLAKYISANIGAFYLIDESKTTLSLTGKYAFNSKERETQTFKVGEGLVGQVAADKQICELKQIDPNHIRLSSTLIDTPPNHVILTPVLFENEVIGVLEFGKLEPIDSLHHQFLELIVEAVGIAINSSISRQKIQELLEETQVQSEELQSQQEELKQTNEELEEQTQNLKHQQEELQMSNEELEEQTQALEAKNKEVEAARYDIEQKTKQLELTSKYKSEFLANMSHELRTPLNSLLILSKDLAENKNNNLIPDQIESAEIIYKSGHDLLTLINEVLDLSKVEAGKMSLNIERLSLRNIMHDLAKTFKSQVEQKGITLILDIEDQITDTIKSDVQRLEQVLKNLMSNAVKFTDKGSITIKVSQPEESKIAISVIDTGIGIPKDKQMAIFEAFQQADGSTSRKYGGTGLGLSISRELAMLLEGEIQLTSELNKGSTFTLTIPVELNATNNTPEQPKHKLEEEKPMTVQSNNILSGSQIDFDDKSQLQDGDKTVLVIEDDIAFSKVLLKQAHEKGLKCIIADSGEDGLVLANQYKPNAIILDIGLPGINGNRVLGELKANPSTRHIPVHIMSAEERSLEPIKSGAVEYLTKPVKKKELENVFGRIENFINRKMRNLLIIEDDENARKAMRKLIGNGDVKCLEAGSGETAINMFKENHIDCIVLDIGLPDMTGFELIKELESLNDKNVPPIIIYTGKELTKEENNELLKHAESIIIKGVKSEDRLLDETALFLHRTIGNLPESKQQIITNLYDKDHILKGKQILVVDDDMRNVFALSKILKERGMEIVKAENGLYALEQLKSNDKIDMVLMDIMMPEMDGYEAMQKIRAQKKYKTLPIIALTAKAMKEDRQKCIDAGANDYISKPVDINRLLTLMNIWLSK